MSEILLKAREYEEYHSAMIGPDERPAFHLSPRVGWMNDPNGFSTYKGRYHLFYQYHPYNTKWGPMHWGHAVSDDLLRWQYLPAAIAPDMPYDRDGCFSGSAIELDDGRHLLVYTGVKREQGADDRGFELFRIRFARDSRYETSLTYCPGTSTLRLSRIHAGFNRDFVHERECMVRNQGGEIRLRILLDRYSAEVFVNDGEQAMTTTFYTPQSADGISFHCSGRALVTVEKFDILMAE